jgi:hypothetical protein
LQKITTAPILPQQSGSRILRRKVAMAPKQANYAAAAREAAERAAQAARAAQEAADRAEKAARVVQGAGDRVENAPPAEGLPARSETSEEKAEPRARVRWWDDLTAPATLAPLIGTFFLVLATLGLVLATNNLVSAGIDTERRQASGEFLKGFDSDDVWRARLTLVRYHHLLCNDPRRPKHDFQFVEYAIALTLEYTAYYVYHDHQLMPATNAESELGQMKEEGMENFFLEVDKSRRRLKTFYQDIMIAVKQGIVNLDFERDFISIRFYQHAGDFLTRYWSPVEIGQNKALYTDLGRENAQFSTDMVDFFQKKQAEFGYKPETTPICRNKK